MKDEMEKMRKLIVLLSLIMLMTACARQNEAEPILADREPRTLTIMTHDSFAISEATITAFEREHVVNIELLPAGDAGAALNQAILAQDNPLADIFYGVDNSFLSRALDADIFIPYQSPELANVPDELELDDSYRLLPVDFGDVCLNYDKAWFADNGVPVPNTLSALTDPVYKGLLVVENPGTSSPGLSFLLATIGQFGEDGYLDYWRALRQNETLVTNGWQDAYYGQFSVAGDGARPLVVSYASSPAAEFIFADPPAAEPPSASITAPGMCFRQIEFVGILKGTAYPDLAQDWVDFMLSKTFQEDIPLNMFVFPANETAVLPSAFVEWAQIPDQPAAISPADIEANREKWIEDWTEAVLR